MRIYSKIVIVKPNNLLRGIRPDLIVIDDNNYTYKDNEVDRIRLEYWVVDYLYNITGCDIICSKKFKDYLNKDGRVVVV